MDFFLYKNLYKCFLQKLVLITSPFETNAGQKFKKTYIVHCTARALCQATDLWIDASHNAQCTLLVLIDFCPVLSELLT